MSSIAKYIYPQVVWQERQKKLWNPIHKKALKNLPEERVRLRIMEALIRAGWSKHRISTEESVGQLGDQSMRSDLICYTQQFEPKLLIECKAEHIRISAKTAEQVARYNQKVGADFLLMTNGVSDYWYAIDKAEAKQLDGEPDLIEGATGQPEYHFDDWKQRGFAGEKASPNLRLWLEQLLPDLWFPGGSSSVQFLSFNDGPSDIDLNHYYRIIEVGDDRRLAISTINTAFGGNRMIVILNRENENKAVLEVNLDVFFADKKGNASVYSREGIRAFDLSDYIDLKAINETKILADKVETLFKNHVD
ncbi:type I restriction enzyme HsdR N-terminal domain-containing protein [Fodinibius sp. Rm-B-1B1-1]|uniref:type I restriction enzyme HsdR N-terminal domain-containing protein n=1 Tax=Fodinibius alkaliphilus TaxID=3140241 RepID=UPI00315A86C0